MLKKIIILSVCSFLLILPANCANWINLGNGMSIDKDGLVRRDDVRVIVIKFTNPPYLEAFKYFAQPPRALSVCAIQETLKCSTNYVTVDAILCYDTNGQIAVDVTGSDLNNKSKEFPFTCDLIDSLSSEDLNSYK